MCVRARTGACVQVEDSEVAALERFVSNTNH